MKRINTLLAVLTAMIGPSGLQGQTIRAIEARVINVEGRVSIVEQRLSEIEKQLSGESQTDTYSQDESTTQNEETALQRPEAKPQSYVIRDGDSIGGIARKFGIPRQALLKANDMIEGQPIYIGEPLVIPQKPEHGSKLEIAGDGKVHTVVPGDTLMGLSRRYGTSVESIKAVNRLRSDVIGTGRELIIPTKSNMAEAQPAQEPEPEQKGKYQYDNPLLNSDETYGYYTVEKGDNLYALARDFFTSMNELQRLNEMRNKVTIYPGEELIVPTSKYNDYHNNVVQN